jgi:hypothetical protein
MLANRVLWISASACSLKARSTTSGIVSLAASVFDVSHEDIELVLVLRALYSTSLSRIRVKGA